MKKRKFDVNVSTAIKGIAILMMILHHCFRTKSVYSNFEGTFFPFEEYFVVNMAVVCKICVSIFAFISGYGMYLSYKKRKTSINSWVLIREIKLLSGYWFIWLVSMIVCQLIDGKTEQVYFSKGIRCAIRYISMEFLGMSNLFGTPSMNGAWWYMGAAVCFIILVPFLMKNVEYMELIYIASLLLLRLLGIDYMGSNGIYCFIPVFIVGMIFAKNDWINLWINNGNVNSRIFRFIIEVVLMFIGYKMYIAFSDRSFWEFKWNVYPILIILFCAEFIVIIPVLKNVLKYLGEHSRNIFLVHIFIKTHYLNEYIFSFNNWIMVMVMLLVISWLISVLVELLKKITRFDKIIDNICKKIEEKSIISE